VFLLNVKHSKVFRILGLKFASFSIWYRDFASLNTQPVYLSALDQFQLMVSLVIHRRYRFHIRLIPASKRGKKAESLKKKVVEHQTFLFESYLYL
jgi:hypothetical protein